MFFQKVAFGYISMDGCPYQWYMGSHPHCLFSIFHSCQFKSLSLPESFYAFPFLFYGCGQQNFGLHDLHALALHL